ncbi:hypothetical protein SUGI_0713110, partial [Cryptomeria japonica]
VKRRTVTNVGGENVVYKVLVKSSPNVNVSMEPDTLLFKKVGDQGSFNDIREQSERERGGGVRRYIMEVHPRWNEHHS